MISAIKNKLKMKSVVIVSSILVGIIVVAGLIILFSAGVSKTKETFDYQAAAQKYGVSENVAYLINRTQQYNENADVEMLTNMSITEIVDNLRNEYVNVFKYKKIAGEYGVSQDAAYIVDRIVMIDSNADIKLLVNLPISELVDTLREKLLLLQTPDAEEANSQGTEVAYADEAEDVDTEEANEEPAEDVDAEEANEATVEDADTKANEDIAEDVDTESKDTGTPKSDSDSGDTNPEEPKPTQKPEEQPQKTWSQWSIGFETYGEMWDDIAAKGLESKEIEQNKIEQCTTIISQVEEVKYRERIISWSEWTHWMDREPTHDERAALNDKYHNENSRLDIREEWIEDQTHPDGGFVRYKYKIGTVTSYTEWSEWMPQDEYVFGMEHDTWSRTNITESEWKEYHKGLENVYSRRTLLVYRWRDV